jgi:hypothetical protein
MPYGSVGRLRVPSAFVFIPSHRGVTDTPCATTEADHGRIDSRSLASAGASPWLMAYSR